MDASLGVTGFPFQPVGRTPPGHLEAREVYAIASRRDDQSWSGRSGTVSAASTVVVTGPAAGL